MRIVLYNQYYIFEDYSLGEIEKLLSRVLLDEDMPEWVVIALIDEKLSRNEWYYYED
jgi:hypothetical protein